MRFTLLAFSFVAMTATACAPGADTAAQVGPDGRGSGAASLAGTLNGEEIRLSHAYYGVALNLGSHAEQQAGAPVTYWADLRLEPDSVDCSTLGAGRFEGFDLDFVQLVAGRQDVKTIGNALPPTGARAFAIGSMEIESDTLTGLPDRSSSAPPFEQVAGTIRGTMAAQFVSCSDFFAPNPCPDADSDSTGSVAGAFVAEHCPALDSVSGE